MRLYSSVNSVAAVVSLALSACLLFFPDVIFTLFGMEGTEPAAMMLRRASVLFLGLALICWLTRNTEDPAARNAIAVGSTAIWIGFAGTGVFEFLRGAFGPGVWAAIAVEITLGLLYARVWLSPGGSR